MKRTRRVLAFLMALVMAATVTCITAFAAQKKQYHGYTFFGDSVTAAAGIKAYYDFFTLNPETGKTEGTAEGQRVPGSYPDLVAAGVGINDGLNNYYNESHSGWRTSEVREVLDDSYYNDDGAVAKALSLAMANGKAIADPADLRDRVRSEIATSDLITLDLGSNDVQLPIIMTLYSVLNPTESADYRAWAIEKLLNELGSVNEVINYLSQAVVAIHGVEFALEQIAKATLTGLNKFRVNYPVIINKIREINPDADIYVIGLYNPLSDTKISEEIPLRIGKLLDPMMLSMNLYLSTLNPAKRYYTYVDAFNTAVLGTINVSDLFSSETGLSAEGMGTYTLYVHPSEEGHAYIANQVLKAIPDEKEQTAPAEPTNEPTKEPAEETGSEPTREPSIALNGLAKGSDGRWAMYDNNKVDTSFTGLVKQPANGVWYYVEDGYVNWGYTGFVKNEKGWWRVKDGRVDFNANSIYKQPTNGVWYKTTNGFINWNESSIYKNENGWWKCTGSRVTFKETGIFDNEKGTWYVVNSKVAFDKTGKVKVDGKTYTLQSGRVVA